MKKFLSVLCLLLMFIPTFADNNIFVYDRNINNAFMDGFEYKIIQVDTNKEYFPVFKDEGYQFLSLPIGKYKLVQTKHPEKYLQSPDVDIELVNDNEVVKIYPKYNLKPEKPSGRTCQDDGFPVGYYWDEEKQQCLPNITNYRSFTKTNDSGVLWVYPILTSAVISFITTTYILKKKKER